MDERYDRMSASQRVLGRALIYLHPYMSCLQ